MLIYTTKSIQSGFGETPKALNANDMGSVSGAHPGHGSLTGACQNQYRPGVVISPTLGIEDAVHGNATADKGLERGYTGVRDDFCIDITIAFENARSSRFTESATPPNAFYALGAEIRFIHFNYAREWRLPFEIFSNAFPETTQIPVYDIEVVTRERNDLRRVQIQCK
jgi:hypothetical protein